MIIFLGGILQRPNRFFQGEAGRLCHCRVRFDHTTIVDCHYTSLSKALDVMSQLCDYIVHHAISHVIPPAHFLSPAADDILVKDLSHKLDSDTEAFNE